ncbi:MAG: hypothetical protein Q7S09_05200 [bacterium]|nr:hypothetical protein [bacterium]
MSWEPITPEQFKELLPSICSEETSQDAKGWTPDNPLWGHCAVVSLVAQNLFGGKIWRAEYTDRQSKTNSHYWNECADGAVEDFTVAQFGYAFPEMRNPVVRDRVSMLYHKEGDSEERKRIIKKARERYKLLAFRLLQMLYGANKAGVRNPLFYDPIYCACFEEALDSPCRKMKFGCVITHEGAVVYRGCNKTIEPLHSLCDPACIRLSITSRTEQMLGACGHAEEFALWEVARKGIALYECDLYIAGFYPNGLPWLKTSAEHTCLRCSTQMYQAQVRKIYVPMNTRLEEQSWARSSSEWRSITPQQAVSGALCYAMKEKSIDSPEKDPNAQGS